MPESAAPARFFDALVDRDELLTQRDELQAEVVDLRAQLRAATTMLNAQIDLVHEQDAELVRLRAQASGGVQ